MAKYKADNPAPPPDGVPVALHIGNAIHAEITGHEFTPPESITFDARTKTEAEMERAIKSGVLRYRTFAARHGIEILEAEIPMKAIAKVGEVHVEAMGTADMTISEPNDVVSLVDLKTGFAKPTGAMLQVAVYCYLWEREMEEGMDSAGYLWIPRNQDKPVVLHKQPWEAMAAIGRRWVGHVGEIAHRGPMPTPGMHCARCRHPTCAMRP